MLIRALNMLDAPSLDVEDRPSGTIVSTAFSIGWLQDALDLFHNAYPWAGIVSTATINLTAGTEAYTLPADFIMDVRNGLVVPSENYRIHRWPLQKFITASIAGLNNHLPQRYSIHPPNLRVVPKPDRAYTATLWYYALPAVLAGADVPNFPSDQVLVDYVWLRGKEWLKEVPAGTALAYARQQIEALRRSGLAHEPEDDQINFDPETYRPMGLGDRNAWMGSTTA